MVRTVARQEAIMVAIASQRHFLKYETWPDTFDQLTPEFITEFPVDQMNGQFLKLKAEENGVLVYSVGHDLDDDGGAIQIINQRFRDHRGRFRGNPHAHLGGASTARDFDADWILWPQADWESRLPADVE